MNADAHLYNEANSSPHFSLQEKSSRLSVPFLQVMLVTTYLVPWLYFLLQLLRMTLCVIMRVLGTVSGLMTAGKDAGLKCAEDFERRMILMQKETCQPYRGS